MIQTLVNYFLDSLSDALQNPVSMIIYFIILSLILILILASLFNSVRELLVRTKFLEVDEKPSSLIIWIVCVLIIVKLIQSFLIQPFIISGPSMVPTYHDRDFIFLDKLSYRISDIHRGDVIVFKLHEVNAGPYEGDYLIKRVIGLPNERVVVKNGTTTIYNDKNPEGFVLDESFVKNKDNITQADEKLDSSHIFVMGDNRAQSRDSRYFGPIKLTDVRGQVLLRVLPIKNMSFEPGEIKYEK